MFSFNASEVQGIPIRINHERFELVFYPYFHR
eukprot:Gb_37303 [translate_table: standard]